MTRLAVNRPVSVLMASLIVVLLGGISLQKLNVDLMPDITYPTISVTTIYEGAGPEQIENLITRPMEQAVGSVPGVQRLYSSSLEGSSTIRVQFSWGSNLDSAVADIRARIERVRRNLPDEVQTPTIRRFDVADSPIIYLALKSDLDPIAMTHLAEQQISPQLESVDGVAAVRIRGTVRREIQVNLDRTKMQTLKLALNEVINALRRGNIDQPAGDFEEGNVKLLIRSRGEFRNLTQVENTIVREQQGAVVRVRDVAEVIDGREEQTSQTRVNGHPGMLFYINKQSGYNTIEVSDRVKKRMEKINESLADGQELTLRIDKSEFIRQAIENVRMAAVFGMSLALLVLILFLRNFRSTAVIFVSMPLSVMATFVLIYFKGFTLNMVSFGGLALGIGLLVDNSIVVLESIFRKREDGLSAKAASIAGTSEVASAIVASTLTTMIVFLPLLFVQGMTGVLLHQLAWVVSFSLVCSLFASLTVTPVLAAYWIPQEKEHPTGVWERFIGWMHATNHRMFSAVENQYGNFLKICLRRAGTVGFLLLLTFSVTVGLSPRIGTEFLPKTDEGSLRVMANMAPGIQLHLLNQQTKRIEKAILDNVPEAATTAVFIGGGKDDADDWNECFFRLHLHPRSQRERSAEEIRKLLAKKIGIVAGMKVRVSVSNEQMMMRMLRGRRRGGNSDIEIEILGHNRKQAEQLAELLVRRMKNIDGLVNVEIGRQDRRPELSARFDRDKARLLGINIGDITQTLETAVRGTEATIFRDAGDEFKIVVRMRESDRNKLNDIWQVGVNTPDGNPIPLKNLVHFEHGESPVSIDRLNQQRIIGISAELEDRDLGSVIEDLKSEIRSVPVPRGFSLNISGDFEEQQKSFRDLGQGFVLALLLMFMVMASQFESLKDPLLILVTIPLGAIGVIGVMVLSATTLNVQSFIGIILLAGIVVNNAIVLIDYFKQLRAEEPNTPTEELVVRASKRRFRPILMTTLTTVLAMTPMALGWGEGGELQAPMARVVIGGLLSATLTTLLAIPLLAKFAGNSQKRTV